MKFYVTVTCTQVIELEAEQYEDAVVTAHQHVRAILPNQNIGSSKIEVSAVREASRPRYYIQYVDKHCQIKERQPENQDGPFPRAEDIHPAESVIRSFSRKEDGPYYEQDARDYTTHLNQTQMQLDRQYGWWVKRAVKTERATESTVVNIYWQMLTTVDIIKRSTASLWWCAFSSRAAL